jgi:hypothetical protein
MIAFFILFSGEVNDSRDVGDGRDFSAGAQSKGFAGRDGDTLA